MAYEGKRRTSDELAAYRQNIKGSRETVASFRGCCAACMRGTKAIPGGCGKPACGCHKGQK